MGRTVGEGAYWIGPYTASEVYGLCKAIHLIGWVTWAATNLNSQVTNMSC